MASSGSESSASWNSSAYAEEDFPLYRYIIVGIAYGIIIILTVVGNFMVMVSFYRDRHISSKIANWYILNLSVADFTIGLVSMTLNIIWWMVDDWPFGKITCQIWLFVDYVSVTVPIYTIICISLDRYWLLTKTLEYPKYATKTKAIVFLVLMWAFCISFYGVVTFAWIPITGFAEEIEYDWNCELEATYNFEFQLFTISFFFLLPLFIIIYFNLVVYQNIRKRSKGFVRSKPAATLGATTTITGTVAKRSQPQTSGSKYELKKKLDDLPKTQDTNLVEDKKKADFNRHRKAAITLAVLVGVFVICWLPYYITTLLSIFCEECVHVMVWEVTNNLLWCNSTINPFLYAAMNIHFRENFIKLLGLQSWFKNR